MAYGAVYKANKVAGRANGAALKANEAGGGSAG